MELQLVILAQVALALALLFPSLLALSGMSRRARQDCRCNRSPYTARAAGKFAMFGPPAGR